MASIPVRPPLEDTFDATAWLAEWSDNGGIYMLVGDMLHLRRIRPIDPWNTANLDRLRAVMLRSGGGPAIADLIRRRQESDVA